MTEGVNVIKNLLGSFFILSLATIVPSESPLYCSAIPRNTMGRGREKVDTFEYKNRVARPPFLLPRKFSTESKNEGYIETTRYIPFG